MTFNSIQFAVFLALFLAADRSVPARWRNPLTLAGSYVFYGWWDARFLSLIVISTLVDFVVGLRMADAGPRHRRLLLATSLTVNLGLLGFFKYFGFFVDSFADAVERVGLGAVDSPALEILLPVGISFYTFQTMSYTIDVYRGRLEPCRNLIDFATFVAFFPQLVAGPIERAKHLLPQLVERRNADAGAVRSGLALIALGLFRKVVVADGAGRIANEVFDAPQRYGTVMTGVAVVAFAVQIYGDFAGYTDIARGVSRLLGVELLANFRQPYLSRNITEFWRRWHISLSNWLRDYLYIPLGGNRHGTVATYRNLMLTMLLGGLWHGASWNFVLWGGLHGLYLVVHRLLRGGRVDEGPVRPSQVPGIIVTFAVVALTWVPFRAPDLATTVEMLGDLVVPRRGNFEFGDALLVMVLAWTALATDVAQRHADRLAGALAARPALAGVGAGLVFAGLVLFSGGTPQPFVYFQF